MKIIICCLVTLLLIPVEPAKTQNMRKEYKTAVETIIEKTSHQSPNIVTVDDIEHLPDIVQKYLNYTGVVDKPLPLNFKAIGIGGIRSSADQSFMKFKSEQYNSFDTPVRAFYIKARKMGIPASALHLYQEETAFMKVKLAGLIKLVDARGPEMNQGETVTFFNDICCIAPAQLTDKNIQWEPVDELTVKASYTNGELSISAVLYFKENGELINFKSYDRFETADGKEYHNYPWETPVLEYKNIRGYRLPSKAKLIYKHPDRDFCYGEYELLDVQYNIKAD